MARVRRILTNDHGQPVGPPLNAWAPRAFPAPVRLAGRYCRLEPLSPEHAPALYEAVTRDASGRQWTYLSYGPFAGPRAFADFVDATVADPGHVTLTIVDAASGRPAGWASYLRIDPAVGSIEVGGITFGAALQRTAAATEAMYLMAAHAIDDLGYRRYEWKCDDLNAPSRAAATRLGFAYEGTFRNATIYKGRSRDTAWFAITDDDWPSLRAAIRSWLDPATFDADGTQRRSLSSATRAARKTLDSAR